MSKRKTGNVRKSNSPWKHLVQATRHADAEKRQVIRAARGDRGQLLHLDGLGYTALKERAKLLVRLSPKAQK